MKLILYIIQIKIRKIFSFKKNFIISFVNISSKVLPDSVFFNVEHWKKNVTDNNCHPIVHLKKSLE